MKNGKEVIHDVNSFVNVQTFMISVSVSQWLKNQEAVESLR